MSNSLDHELRNDSLKEQ